MASAMSSTTAAVSRSVPTQASMSPFIGQKLSAAFPITRKNSDSASMRKGFKVSCMKVWPTQGKKKFETLSYLPDLSREQLLKEIDYLIRSKWIPCLEFELGNAFVYRENHKSPGYYDGRYWTMWKLPMYGCSDAVQVMNEVDEVVKAHPTACVRIIGFDNVRQVQCISFIAYKPPNL